MARSACSWNARCKTTQPAPNGFENAATCASVIEAWCRAGLSLVDAALTADVLDQCATDIEESPCVGDSFLPESDVKSCLFHGKRKDGAACGDGLQCESGMCGDGTFYWAWPRAGKKPAQKVCMRFDW